MLHPPSHQKLIEIAIETEVISNENEYLDSSCNHFCFSSAFYPAKPTKTGFLLLEGDILENAKATGSSLVLIYASHRRPGGGWRNGKTSQEESIYLRTNLCTTGLQRTDSFYQNEGINPAIVQNAVVFRDADYQLVEPWKCDFVYLAAPVVTNEKTRKTAEKRIAKQIHSLVDICSKRDSIVIGPWGCGVYGNDPRCVATIFKKAFTPLLKNMQVVVTVQRDENGKVFREIFDTV